MLNKLTTYLAGFIEASPEGAIDWRAEISEKLQSKDLMVYCPVKFEAKKTATGIAAGSFDSPAGLLRSPPAPRHWCLRCSISTFPGRGRPGAAYATPISSLQTSTALAASGA